MAGDFDDEEDDDVESDEDFFSLDVLDFSEEEPDLSDGLELSELELSDDEFELDELALEALDASRLSLR